MTNLLEEAVALLSQLSKPKQDEIARRLLEVVADDLDVVVLER